MVRTDPPNPPNPFKPSVLDAGITASKESDTRHRITARVGDVPLASGVTGATTVTELRDVCGERA
jgi:hypothetical protein